MAYNIHVLNNFVFTKIKKKKKNNIKERQQHGGSIFVLLSYFCLDIPIGPKLITPSPIGFHSLVTAFYFYRKRDIFLKIK